MFNPGLTPEYLEQIKTNLQACRDWFHSTFSQPYTVEEMTETLAYYLNAHLYYYSNKTGLAPEKQQRIFRIINCLESNHFKLTQEMKIRLATTSDKKSLLQGEIARYEHPFLFYKMGHYANETVDIVIPHIMDTLAENHSPYFEFVFDDNLEVIGSEILDFFISVYFLQYSRRELVAIEAGGKKKERPTPHFDCFEDLFKVKDDFPKLVTYLKSIFVLDDEGQFIESSGNKKYLAILLEVLRKKSKIKPISDIDAAPLIKKKFGIASFSSTYMGKYFPGREELIEEIMKDLRL